MKFIFSTTVLIRHLWKLETFVFLHWFLIYTVLLVDLKSKWRNISRTLNTMKLLLEYGNWVQCYKTFYGRNKQEGLSLPSFSGLFLSLWVRLGANPRVEHLKDASLKEGSGLAFKH